jgi:DNA-directed RNA polymerase subunit RPC12/RpoP
MSRQIRCPNCGGEHSLVNPGITMLVCNYCQTVVYWGSDGDLKTGQRSILPESDTRLFLFATGSIKEDSYQVIGHLRYASDNSQWDEWYVSLGSGKECWLSEDGRQLTLERPVDPDVEIPSGSTLRVSDPIALEKAAFTVREVGNATCIGGEGQLPFTVLPGETYPYADVADTSGTRFGSIEFDEDDKANCFLGETLSHDELTVHDERAPGTSKATTGKKIDCAECGAALETPQGRDVETLVCAYCGTQLDLTGAERAILGRNPEGVKPSFFFEIGDGGSFRGSRYEVCGRLMYADPEGYRTHEYLLHNPDQGYLWLAEEYGHFVLNRPSRQAPARDPFALHKSKRSRRQRVIPSL